MNLLALPGKNQTTHQWCMTLLNTIDIGATTTAIQKYDCWLTPGEEINLELESGKAKVSGPDIVLAKSLGTVIAATAFAEISTNMKFIFIGTPIQLYRSDWMVSLKKLPLDTDVLFIQQRFDRTGTAKELRSALSEKCTLKEIPGSDHLYNDTANVVEAIESWCKCA